jgi:hypothetical protein
MSHKIGLAPVEVTRTPGYYITGAALQTTFGRNMFSPIRTNLFRSPERTSTAVNTIVQQVPPNINPVKRMFCCSCHATNRMDPTLTFLKIPKTTIKLTSKTNDFRRLQYYMEHLRRKLYCQRLGVLIVNRDRQYLTFCSLHKLQSECIDVTYKKKDGTRETINVKVTLPEDPQAPIVPSTRAKKQLISSPPPRGRSRKKKTTVNDENDDNQHSDNGEDIILGMDGTDDEESTDDESAQSAEVVAVKSPKKKFRLCCYHKCTSRLSTKMTPIPTIGKNYPKQYNTHNYERMYRSARILNRTECLKWAGVPNYTTVDTLKDLRLCYKHKFDSINKVVEYIDLKGEKQYSNVIMVVPFAYDDKNKSVHRSEEGRRSGRFQWKNKIEDTKRLAVELATQLGVPKEEWTTVIMQTLKRKEQEQGIGTITSNNSTPMSAESKKKMKVVVEPVDIRNPKYLLNQMDDNIIHLNTGFPSVSAMLCYIIIINKGNTEDIINQKTTNKMTWFEEYLFFFECLWGRWIVRWSDGSYQYGVSEKLLATVFDDKVQLVLRTRHVWGLFVTHHEDCLLRLPKWSDGEFHHQRLIMWDNTNVPLCFNPSVRCTMGVT